MKRLISLMLTVCLVLSLFAVATTSSVQAESVSYGLTVNEDGTIEMQGEAFYGFGGNAFFFLDRVLTDPLYDLDGAFKTFADYDIPVVRVPFGTSGTDGFELWQEDPETFFLLMDMIIKAAEKHQVGIIATITWWFPFVHLMFNEPVAAIGDSSSKSNKFAVEYTTAIVKRYAKSPAIFGWEITNEMNLCADLCGGKDWAAFGVYQTDAEIDGYDFYTTKEALVYMNDVATAIAKNDPYGRMISNGNAKIVANQMSKKKASDAMDKKTHTWSMGWGTDTLEEFRQISLLYTADPIDTMSSHIGRNEVGYGDFTCDAWGKTVTYKEYLIECVNSAKLAKKAFYLGEFGDMAGTDMETLFDERKLGTNKQYTKQFVEDTLAAGVQLATCWQFAYDATRTHQINDDFPLYTYLLKLMQKANKDFQKQGKQNVDKYWSSVSNAFYNVAKPTTTSKTTSTTTKASTKTEATATTTKTEESTSTSASITTEASIGESSTTTATDSDVVGNTQTTTTGHTDVLDDDQPKGVSPVVWILLGAVVLAGGVTAVLVVMRRKKTG